MSRRHSSVMDMHPHFFPFSATFRSFYGHSRMAERHSLTVWSITYLKLWYSSNLLWYLFNGTGLALAAMLIQGSLPIRRMLEKRILSSGVRLNIPRSLQHFPTSNTPIRSPQISTSNRWPACCSVWFTCPCALPCELFTHQLGNVFAHVTHHRYAHSSLCTLCDYEQLSISGSLLVWNRRQVKSFHYAT
ncbi:hypothetical protein F4804DRAFT_161973 [Jackrogersella minutella]|nr:hypothetical protein F4804DRAFT_161973 [Jackrogersella minutella]